jgi:hypothetical protein
MDLKVYCDKFADADYEVIATGVPEPKCDSGIIYAPYIPILLTEPRAMNDEYTLFMNEYNRLHSHCPECGSTSNVQTLLAFILNLSKKEEYVDRNGCTCCGCGWTGIVHDLV